MRTIEQIAIKTQDIQTRIADIGPIYPFNGSPNIEDHPAHATDWVVDEVTAVHVFLHPGYLAAVLGDKFSVRLAFNYDIIPGRELELIQLLDGHSVQLDPPFQGLSHLGYHIVDDRSLFGELMWWEGRGYLCTQISATVSHTGTPKRYVYAFIDTRAQIGFYTKVISRVTYPRTIESLVEEFEHVNRTRR